MLLTLFPAERPQYPEGKPEGERMEIRLSRGRQRVTASCLLVLDGARFSGRASAVLASLGGALEEDRKCQRLVKNAM